MPLVNTACGTYFASMTLVQYLKETGKKAADIARDSKMTRGGISRLLAGTRMPSLPAALAIQNATDGKVGVGDWTGKKSKKR